MHIVSEESLFWISPGPPVTRACDFPIDGEEKFSELFEVLLSKGIYLSPSAYEVNFVGLAHGPQVSEELERRLFY